MEIVVRIDGIPRRVEIDRESLIKLIAPLSAAIWAPLLQKEFGSEELEARMEELFHLYASLVEDMERHEFYPEPEAPID